VQSVRFEAERSAIATALEKTGWNRKAAARLLKVSYRTLLYKIEQYHMSASEAHAPAYPGNGTRGNGKRI
jgi:DNA-binding NtrC family response regulator